MRTVEPIVAPTNVSVLRWQLLLLLLCLVAVAPGCGPTEWLVRTDSLAPWMKTSPAEWIKKPLKPTRRTTSLLGRLDLKEQLSGDPEVLLASLQKHLEREQTPELLYAYTEIAFLAAQKIEPVNQKRAFDIYAASVAHAYLYLFDPRLEAARNPFDPHFREVSDIYNKSLDRALRIVAAEGGLRPGNTRTCNALDHIIDVRVVAPNISWGEHDIERFEFVSDFRTTGINNRYRTYGLGVPMVAVRKRTATEIDEETRRPPGVERFYPDTLALPVTAFLRLDPTTITGPDSQPRIRATLELIDPLVENHVEVAGQKVPIESDLTTPIAYGLDSMEFDDFTVSTFSMLAPESAQDHHGLFMMEPYQPNKIPVVFVHGLWSSPVTWVEMFNDLRGDPAIRARYQFWYYFYPSGQPFLYTGTTLRQELSEIRRQVDPQRNQPSLDEMVLVGHSMGGLVSKLQSVDSGDEFWDRIAEQPFHELDVDDETREQLAEVFYFRANRSIRRVVTIATPHEGSQLANSATRWLARAVFTTPKPLEELNARLRNKPQAFKFKHPFSLPTSIDTLTPDSPALVALKNRPRPPWITYNNVYGEVEDGNWFSRFNGPSDGVVPVKSAVARFASSTLKVPASHQTIHSHPRTVLEMRRILKEHLAMLDDEAATRLAHQQQYRAQLEQQMRRQQAMHEQQEHQRQAALQANAQRLPQVPVGPNYRPAHNGPLPAFASPPQPAHGPQRYPTIITGARPLPETSPPQRR